MKKEMPPFTDPIPEHLTPFIVEQDYSLYTPIDHAAWRFILRISRHYLKNHAHPRYIEGIKETGISTEKIPLISEMDEKLKTYGWRAVAVSGFIPPSVFMEFQSLGILPIACDMRSLDHLAYTPAPDIVHEAAGHAPLIIDPEYSIYLRSYGEVARKAIYSNQDMTIYSAIRNLSEVKENPKSSSQDIEKARLRLDHAIASVDYVSEAAYLARMNWWTVEYGLTGSWDRPMIYGAGLLSSVGESYSCLDESVMKLPFTLDCVNMVYDITRPQPQLFITPDFSTLTRELENYSKTMAFYLGGVEALAKAKISNAVTTTVLDTGIQISGVLKNFLGQDPFYLQFTGPVQLSFNDQEILGHGPQYHLNGFGTALGKIDASDVEKIRKSGEYQFSSGVTLSGTLEKVFEKNNNPLILTFSKCTVKYKDLILFHPDWGTYDLVCGSSVVSVFGGAADRSAYNKGAGIESAPLGVPKTNATVESAEINGLYQKVREIRESGDIKSKKDHLLEIFKKVRVLFPEDWLLTLEIFELTQEPELLHRLEEFSKSHHQSNLIERGLDSLKSTSHA